LLRRGEDLEAGTQHGHYRAKKPLAYN